MKINFSILVLLLIVSTLRAQLIEIGLQSNPEVEKYSKTHLWKNYRNIGDTLELPFFDDFAKSKVYPDTELWEDNFVFINTEYPIDPPTIGVATFDMLNQSGEIYSTASNMGFLADKLTSKPINLDYPGDTTIYFSFYYQPQGISGNAPEFQDSLVLQFTSPDTTWATVWMTTGTAIQSFKQVIIQISDPLFLENGFQFRFINYGSIADNSFASWAGNGDIWNIDFVYLNKNRHETDTSYSELSLVYPLTSFVNDFESVPLHHFDFASNLNYHKNFTYQIKNLRSGIGDIQVKNRHIYMNEEISGTIPSLIYTGGADNVHDNSTMSFSPNLNVSGFLFQDNGLDSADFKFNFYLTIDTVGALSKFRWNDTMEYHQQFYNYYAYDDGSPEAGLGLFGVGTSNAKVAYRFGPMADDTLRGVKIFFNRTYLDASRKYFILKVWSDNNGKPDAVIYEQLGYRPEYEDSLNNFHYYALDSLIYITDTFYIGWEKTTEDMLNVGFDKNRNVQEKIFYNIYGSWQQSTYSGALMIRPVFGKDFTINNELIESNRDFDIQCYPNPVQDNLFIELPPNLLSSEYSVQLLNIYGKTLKAYSKFPQQISVANYPDGIYILLIKNYNGAVVSQKRFVIVR